MNQLRLHDDFGLGGRGCSGGRGRVDLSLNHGMVLHEGRRQGVLNGLGLE